MDKKVEILAPAGTIESFYAAINAGADAIYLGGNMFGARAFAGNFNNEQLIEALRYAHIMDKKIYLTVNTLLRNEELDKLYDYLLPFYEEGLDACIVQDMGVFRAIKEYFPDMDIHASTQMTLTGKLGAKLLCDLGASRIVTSREISLKEIKDIHDNVDVEIETFVHGALCYSYSGECLLSSMIGQRSGNRGRCAQPCRLPYSCGDYRNKYLLSPKDLCALKDIPELIEAGVYSMKIEGRMKSPIYTSAVVNAYRRYADKYLEFGADNYRVSEKDMKELLDIYNRGGFCNTYLYEKNNVKMMTFDRPNHRGLEVGKVKNGKIILDESVSAGDVLELSDGSEMVIDKSFSSGSTVSVLPGHKISNNSIVLRTKNKTLSDKIEASFCTEILKKKIDISAVIKVSEVLKVTVALDDISITVEGDVLSESQNRPAVKEEIISRLCKLGNTYFYCDEASVNVDMDSNVFVPIKALNEARRQACELLNDKLVSEHKRTAKKDKNELFSKCAISQVLSPSFENNKNIGKVSVQVMTKEQALLISTEYIDKISEIVFSTEVMGISNTCKIASTVKSDSISQKLALPYIFRQHTANLYEKLWSEICESFDGFVVRNYEEIEFLKAHGVSEFTADYDLYAYNDMALLALKDLGATEFRLSEELNEKQLKNLTVRNSDLDYWKIVYGRLPLMVTAGCTRSYTLGKAVCGTPGFYELQDRKNISFLGLSSCECCYNLLYNGVPIFLFDKAKSISSMGAGYVFMFSNESPDETRKVLESYFSNSEYKGDYTRGHFNRGVE